MADDTDFDGLTLDELRRRRSEKWLTHPADVLPSFVAELDVPLAEPIRRALRDAVERGDTSYTDPAGLPVAFAGFDRMATGIAAARGGTAGCAAWVPARTGTAGSASRSPRGPGRPGMTQRESEPAVSTAARPASSRATGMRNGEQET